jgi:hypothetical protein
MNQYPPGLNQGAAQEDATFIAMPSYPLEVRKSSLRYNHEVVKNVFFHRVLRMR